jgi:hypothetical protein
VLAVTAPKLALRSVSLVMSVAQRQPNHDDSANSTYSFRDVEGL